MQRVKRIDGYYTLENKGGADKLELLCDQCGISECSIRMVLTKLKINRFNAKLAVKRCESFIPRLEFRDNAGMEAEFNTFRLGGAWFTRVAVGQLVNLSNPLNGWQAVAEVTGVHRGTFAEMARLYGADNHLAIDAELSERDFSLADVMRQCYGPQRFSEQSTVTVIQLRRVDD